MASSSTAERNRRNRGRQPAPPQAPAAAVEPVYLQDLFLGPADIRRRELGFLCRSLSWYLFIFIATSMLAFVVWLLLHPNVPGLSVSSAVLTNVSTSSGTVKVACSFTLVLTNTNSYHTTLYDRFDILLTYPSQEVLLSQDFLPPFEQHKRNKTEIHAVLGVSDAYFSSKVAEAMKQDLDRGEWGLRVHVFAIVSFRNGRWKSRSQFMRASCDGVTFGSDSIKEPEMLFNLPIECHVYLYTE